MKPGIAATIDNLTESLGNLMREGPFAHYSDLDIQRIFYQQQQEMVYLERKRDFSQYLYLSRIVNKETLKEFQWNDTLDVATMRKVIPAQRSYLIL